MNRLKFTLLGTALMLLGMTSVTAQTYHEDDKEGLRIFLRQPSAVAGKINAEQLDLTISDTLNWKTNEAWISKLIALDWNEENPKRLRSNNYGPSSFHWNYKDLAGTLNANKWTKLQALWCYGNELTSLTTNANTMLRDLRCQNNQLTELDISANTELWSLYCNDNQLTELDVSANTKLRTFICFNNHLLLSDLFVASEILKNSGITNFDYQFLGTQNLLAKTITLGAVLDFSVPQNIFNGVYTQFIVTQNGNTVSTSDYTVNDGKITFNTAGAYTVTMTNTAIISDPIHPAEVIFDIIAGNVGIVETDNYPSLRVYPNPTNGQLTINNEQLTIENIEIYNMVGQLLQSNPEFSSGVNLQSEIILDVSHLPSGMYYLKMADKVVKFVKE